MEKLIASLFGLPMKCRDPRIEDDRREIEAGGSLSACLGLFRLNFHAQAL
jgi:hypothetical protein